MIVKVRMNLEDDAWKIYDNVSHIMYNKTDTETLRKSVSNTPLVCDRHQFFTEDIEMIKHTEYEPVLFMSFLCNDMETELTTNHPCFLMNDNGMTVERLF